jgi:flagellar M-ring protein FliF
MDQLKKILASLSLFQRVAIVVVALAVGGGLYGFAHWRKEADFKPLYTGLAAEDSAAVVQKLKESGVEYRISEAGDSVLAPSAKLAELRLDMAAAGLPKTGRIGFEIFDKNNLGATEFVEHINYQRALEGELERSVSSLAEVEQSRVHISFPKDSVFLESREPAKASVLVKLKAGAHLSPRNVTAITHLVASAIEGLDPGAVSVLDMQGNLLSQPARSPGEQESEEALDYRQKVEKDLTQKINATLDPLLGHDRYRASVSADCDLTSGEQSEETMDPARSVMLTSQKTEEVTTSAGALGVPGTASNLPRPTSRPGVTGSGTTRRTENITYQSSRVVRKMKLPQGGIKRISVAVLLDQNVNWEGAGPTARRVVTPPTPQTLQTVHNIVATVVGFTQDRGDQITVETQPFESTLSVPAPASPAKPPVSSGNPQPGNTVDFRGLKIPKMLIPIAGGVLLLVVLAAVAFLVFRIRSGAGGKPQMAKGIAGGAGQPAIEGGTAAEDIEAKMAERQALQKKTDEALLASIKVPPVKTQKTEVLLKQLRENAKKDASTSVHVLQGWLHDRT